MRLKEGPADNTEHVDAENSVLRATKLVYGPGNRGLEHFMGRTQREVEKAERAKDRVERREAKAAATAAKEEAK